MSDLINHTQEDEAFMQDRARTLRLPLDASYRLCVIKWDKFILPQADYVRNRLRSCLKIPTVPGSPLPGIHPFAASGKYPQLKGHGRNY